MAFSTQGAKTKIGGFLKNIISPTNVNSIKTPSYNPLSQTNVNNPYKPAANMSTNNGPALGNNSGILDVKPSTPVKSTTITHPTGSIVKTDYHTPTDTTTKSTSTNSGLVNKDTTSSTPVNNAPVAPTVSGQIQNVANTGAQTTNEAETQKKLADAGAITQWEQDIRNGMAVEQANKRLSDFRQEVAKIYGGIESQAIPLQFQQGREQALARQYAAQEAGLQQGVTNALANQGQQFSAAQTQAGRGATTAGQAYTGAQTQANRAASAANTVLGAVAPVYGVSYGTQVGQPGLPNGGINNNAYGGGPAAAANVQSIKDLTGQVNQIKSVFNGAEANFKLLVDTAKQGGVNDMNIPAINALQQSAQRGFTSSSAVINFQNTLATVRAQYAQILGGGTATVDSQNRAEQAIPADISLGALQSLEQQLKSEANNRVQGINEQIQTLSGQGSTSGGTTGGGFSWDALNY